MTILLKSPSRHHVTQAVQLGGCRYAELTQQVFVFFFLFIFFLILKRAPQSFCDIIVPDVCRVRDSMVLYQ